MDSSQKRRSKEKIMNFENFCFWAHGFFEISNAKTLDETQVKIIKDHLNLCFKKVTPQRYPETSVQPLVIPDCVTAELISNKLCGVDTSVKYCDSNLPPYTGEPYLIEDPFQGQGTGGSDGPRFTFGDMTEEELKKEIITRPLAHGNPDGIYPTC